MQLKNPRKRDADNILFNSAFGALTLVIILAYQKDIAFATFLLAVLALAGLCWWKSRTTTLVFLVGGVLCGLAETTAISSGAWTYAYKNLLGAPMWIYLVWGNSSAFIYQTAVTLKEMLGLED